MISVQIEGAKELENKLLQLERKVGKKIVRTGVRTAQKSLIPVIKGSLMAISRGGGMAEKIAKALTVKAARRNPRGTYAVNVQLKDDPAFLHYPKGSFSSLDTGKTTGKRSYIPAAIEYGHGSNKEQAARPFMRPAADATESSRIKILIDNINKGLAEIWGKK